MPPMTFTELSSVGNPFRGTSDMEAPVRATVSRLSTEVLIALFRETTH